MKQRWFHSGLFRESLRQMRVVSLTSFVILEVITVLTALGYLVSTLESVESETGPETLTMVLANPAILAVPFLLAPLLALYLFRHGNHRNSSDFYHALPCRREALFISQILAAVVSVAVILAVMILTSVAAFSLMRPWFLLNFASVWVTAFNLFATAMLIIGGIALGMSVTGTLLNNIVVSLIILYLPRIFLAFISYFLQWSFSPASPMHLMGILDPPYNLLTSVVINLFFLESPGLTVYLPGGIYTLVLGLLYMVGAGFLFCRRRSEIAGRAAATRGLQTVFRLAVAMVASLLPCGTILLFIINREIVDFLQLFWISVMYVGVLITYFLYELITTKRFRNLLKAIPMLGVLLLLNVLLIAGSLGGRQVLINREIKAENVRSVRLISGASDSAAFGETANYFALKMEKISFEDETMIALLTERYYDWVKAEYIDKTTPNYTSGLSTQLVCFEMKDGTRVYRRVGLSDRDRQKLDNLILKNKALHSLYLELPALDENGTTCTVNGLTPLQSRRLYEVLRHEVSKQSFADWYGTVTVSTAEKTLPEAWLTVTSEVGQKSGAFRITLPTYLSETCRTYLSLHRETHEGELNELIRCVEQVSAVKQGEGSSPISFYLTVNWSGKTGDSEGGVSLDILELLGLYTDEKVASAQNREKLSAFLISLKGMETNKVGPLYYLEAHYLDFENGEKTYRIYVEMPGGEPDPLLLALSNGTEQTEKVTEAEFGVEETEMLGEAETMI